MAIRDLCKWNLFTHDSREFLARPYRKVRITILARPSLTILAALTRRVSITLQASRPGVRQAGWSLTSAANIRMLRAALASLPWQERTSRRSTLFRRFPLQISRLQQIASACWTLMLA